MSLDIPWTSLSVSLSRRPAIRRGRQQVARHMSKQRVSTMNSILLIVHRPLRRFPACSRPRGAAAVLLAVALSGIVGFAGLGSEVASWYYTTRAMQGAADSAVLPPPAALSSATATGATITAISSVTRAAASRRRSILRTHQQHDRHRQQSAGHDHEPDRLLIAFHDSIAMSRC